MAEVLGVVSSVAGLIGLSGQILEGCLFAKSFFDDAKHSPKDVQTILNELEIVRSIAEKTRVLFEQAHNSQALVNECHYEPPLKQSFETVTRLGDKLTEVSRKMGAKGSLRWWEMMKAETRTQVMKGRLVCLERAKSSLQLVQQNMSMGVVLLYRCSALSSIFWIQ